MRTGTVELATRLGLWGGILSLSVACGGSPDNDVESHVVDTGDQTLAEFATGHISQALTDPSIDIEALGPDTSFARLYYVKPNGMLQRICSGAMQTNLLMITARHCVMDLRDRDGNVLPDVTQVPQKFFVHAGRGLSPVNYAVFHPNGAIRDLAGLRLSSPLVLKMPDGGWRSSGYIRPPIAQQPTVVLNDRIPVMLAGYGSDTPGALRRTEVQLTHQRVVSDTPNSIGVDGPSLPQPGDSGGPVFIPMVIMPVGQPQCTGGNCFAFVPLVGVISNGFASTSDMAPSIDILLSWTVDHGF